MLKDSVITSLITLMLSAIEQSLRESETATSELLPQALNE
jgi:hypothetical protein